MLVSGFFCDFVKKYLICEKTRSAHQNDRLNLSFGMNGMNGHKTAIYHLLFAKSGNGNIFICDITFGPIKIQIQLAPQNDHLKLSFIQDEIIVGEKMTRNGQKTAIRAGRLGRSLLDGGPLISSIVVSLFKPWEIVLSQLQKSSFIQIPWSNRSLKVQIWVKTQK